MHDGIFWPIVEGIADAEGVEPRDLDMRLQNHVSTDAIKQLVTHESDSWRLQFETPNHVVEVTGDDGVFVDGDRIHHSPN